MYGLINKAIQDLISEKFGEDKWNEIRKQSGIEDDEFVGMKAYSDDISYKLIAQASKTLDTPSEKLIEELGEYWILFTAAEGYGYLLEATGSSFVEFLQNLDGLHARVRMTLTDLIPPRISCSDISPESMRLHYHSDRPGLCPMVVGLLKGLSKKFNTPLKIEQDRYKEKGDEHDEFIILFTEN